MVDQMFFQLPRCEFRKFNASLVNAYTPPFENQIPKGCEGSIRLQARPRELIRGQVVELKASRQRLHEMEVEVRRLQGLWPLAGNPVFAWAL